VAGSWRLVAGGRVQAPGGRLGGDRDRLGEAAASWGGRVAACRRPGRRRQQRLHATAKGFAQEKKGPQKKILVGPNFDFWK